VASRAIRLTSGEKSLRRCRYAGQPRIAISEAIEDAVSDKSGKTRYSLGSVLNHVLLHQTIIGLEAKKQFEIIGEKSPDL